MVDHLPSLLEGLLIPTQEWGTCGAPVEAVQIAEAETREGVPTGVAKHPRLGWFVIQSSGQGPYIIWPSPEEILSREQAYVQAQTSQRGARQLAHDIFSLPRRLPWREV